MNNKDKMEYIKINNYGWEMKIYEWRDKDDIDIIFLKDGEIAKNRKYKHFKNGSTLHPRFFKMTPEEADRRMNQIVEHPNGHTLKIKEYRKSSDIDVIFDDGSIVEHTTYALFNKASIAHPIEGRSNKDIVTRIVEHTYSCYKNGAKQRKIDFNLSHNDVKRIIFQPCIYCGYEGCDTYIHTKKAGRKYNGIDRINSSKGYQVGNIVPCCSICNKLKHTMSYSEWFDYLDQLASYYKDNKYIINNLYKGE